MKKSAAFELQNGTFQVSGDLCFANVTAVYEKSLIELSKLPILSFDFSRITSSDSSGLALIMEWVKLAKHTNKKISFHHIPTSLLSIAKAAGLDHFFV